MRSLRPLSLALVIAASPLAALAQDAPAVDLAALLKELHRMRDAQMVQAKQTRQTALQQVNGAAGSPERALATWEEAVRAVQFQGATKENSAFREWKDKEGEALSAPLVRNAIRLYFVWLGLTIQRDGDVPVKDLLQPVMAYTRELIADEQAAETLEESIRRERESAPTGKRQQAQQRKVSDNDIRKAHDQILRRPLAAGPVVQWLKLTDFVNPKDWPKSPGDFDAIYTQVVLPELRAQHDARALEYWDFKIKKEGEAAARTKLAFDVDKFTTQRRPALLWSRAEELVLLDQKNRAIGEMFTLIRNNPQHPDVPTWIARLEEIIAPPAAAPAGAETGTAPLPGSAQAAPAVVK